MANIEKYLPVYVHEFTMIDYTTIPFIRREAIIDKYTGKNQCVNYIFVDPATNERVVCVSKTFEERDLDNGGLEIIWKHHFPDSEFPQKSMTKVTYTDLARWQKIEREQKHRKRAINYMIVESVGTPVHSYIKTLFKYYKNEMDEWIDLGNDTWKTKIQNNGNQEVTSILNINLGNNITVKDELLKRL